MKAKKAIAFLLIIVFSFSSLIFSVSAQGYDRSYIASDTEWQMLLLINKARIERGLTPLTMTPMLQVATEKRVVEIGKSGELSGTRPTTDPLRQDWWTVLYEVGMTYNDNCNEIRVSGSPSADAIFKAVMNKVKQSTGEYDYRNILMSEKAVHVGIGFDNSSDKLHNCWSIIVTDCDGLESANVALGENISTIQTVANTNPDDWGIILEAHCKHGNSFIPVLNGMVSTYSNDTIGIQLLGCSIGTVKASFKVYNNFSDNPTDSWYFNSVIHAFDNQYFSGTGNGKFSPDASMTRAMFVVVLSKIANVDLSKYTASGFTDVPANTWYTKAVTWASQYGIVGGTSATHFSPDSPITREQICVMLRAYVEKMGISALEINSEKKFSDDSSISSWAKSAVYFCQRCGFISGNTSNMVLPKTVASRSQVAVIAVNFANSIH